LRRLRGRGGREAHGSKYSAQRLCRSRQRSPSQKWPSDLQHCGRNVFSPSSSEREKEKPPPTHLVEPRARKINRTVPTNSPRHATKWFLSARRFDSVVVDRDGIPAPAATAVDFVFLGRGILDFKAPHQLHLLQGSFGFPARSFASWAFSATAPPLEPLQPNSALCAAPSLTVVVTPSPIPLSPPPLRVLVPSPVSEVVAEPMSGGERFRLCEGMMGLWNGKTEDLLPCSSIAKMDCLVKLSACESSQRAKKTKSQGGIGKQGWLVGRAFKL
jgi:hypothetical protein